MQSYLEKIVVSLLVLIMVSSTLFPIISDSVEQAVTVNDNEDQTEDTTTTGTRHYSDTNGGYGLVARYTENKPSINGVKSAGEWDDSTYDIVTYASNPIFNLSIKHTADRVYVLVEVPGDDAANSTDYCEIAFDNDHDGTLLEGSDRKFVLYNDNTREEYEGLSGIWSPKSLTFNGKAGSDPVVYEFEIDDDTFVWKDAGADGAIAGLCIHLYANDLQDSGSEAYSYWPDLSGLGSGRNPVSNPINDTTKWGDLFYNRPRLVINELSSFGSGNSEWVEIYNGGNDIDLNGINITNQNGQHYILSKMTFPFNSYFVLKSGGGVDDLDFSDGKGTKYLGSELTWAADTWDNDADDVLVKYGGNDCGVDFVNYTNGMNVPQSYPFDTKSENRFSIKFGGWLDAPGNNKVSLSRVPNGADTDLSRDWVLTSLISEGEKNQIGIGSPGFGLVAIESETAPKIDGIMNNTEWSDAKYDLVSITDTDYFTVYSKISGLYLYVCVELDPTYDSTVEDGDYAILGFDKNHDGGFDPQTDDHYVKMLMNGVTPEKEYGQGDGTGWSAKTWPVDWDAAVDDDSLTNQVYEFKINITGVLKTAEGYIGGFGVSVYDDNSGDDIYWPDSLNPGDSWENIPDSWGHIIVSRPKVLINKVLSYGSGHQERIQIINNCSLAVSLHEVGISDQNNGFAILPNVTIPAYKNLTLISGKGENEFDYTDGTGKVFIDGPEWWDDTGDDVILSYVQNRCTLDYMRYSTGSAVDVHPADTKSSSYWTQDTSPLTPPNPVQELFRKPNAYDTDRSSDWSIYTQQTNPLDHIRFTPMNVYPASKQIHAGGTIYAYRAVGWNDEAETEKNLTWTPSWDTTDGKGTLGNFGGSAFTGYTVDYMAGIITGFDNITVENITTVIENVSCIYIYVKPLHHITLDPGHSYPDYHPIEAGGWITAYFAIGWNDQAEKEQNYTWTPVWNTTNGMGTIVGESGSPWSGYTASYWAGLTPGNDNVTVTNSSTGISTMSSVMVNANPIDHIKVMPQFAYPAYKPVKAGTIVKGFYAIAYNDEGEFEQNLTWTPKWSTSAGLGTLKNFGGNPIEGYTVEYKAGYTYGYDNITADNGTSGMTGYTTVRVEANPIHHISMVWKHDHPLAYHVKAGGTSSGYKAYAWNDPGENELNQTWSPTWGTTDVRGTTGNYNGDPIEGFFADYTAGWLPGYDNITITDSKTSISDSSCILITPNDIDHISLTPVYTYPSYRAINAGGTLTGFVAVGYNDGQENEKNFTWSATWGTTDSLGTMGNLGGDVTSGFTAYYNAGLAPGYDNATVTDPANATTARSSVRITSNPLHHITLTPSYSYPIYYSIHAGGTIRGYTAVAWNDAAGNEKNQSWQPVWSTTDHLGKTENYGGDADSGYTADYSADLLPGHDNITIQDSVSGISENSGILISGNRLHHIELIPRYTYPGYVTIYAGGILAGFIATGYNDAAETEKNTTWTASWDTTDGLGTPGYFSGSASEGYVAGYSAALTPGIDNITVTDLDSGLTNSTCVNIYGNPLDHIEITPRHDYPDYAQLSVGDVIIYTATGWNDPARTERNLTWTPAWGISDDLGTLGTYSGNVHSGYTAEFNAGVLTGYDNVTVTETDSGISSRSSIYVYIETTIYLVIISGNNQEQTADTELSDPFVVEVQDGDGTPVGSDVEIRWSIMTAGLSGDGYLVGDEYTYTDSSGRTTNMIYLDSQAGTNIVTAEIVGLSSARVLFTAKGTLPNMALSLGANTMSVVAGSTFNYILHYNNMGSEPAANVWLNITLPSTVSYVTDTASQSPVASGNSYYWNFNALASGFHSFVLTLRVNSDTAKDTLISSSFTVDYSDHTGRSLPRETSNKIEITVLNEPSKNFPPIIANVPDLVVHFEWDYKIDLTPYIFDPDNEAEELFLIFSDTYHVTLDPENNLGIILNYSAEYKGITHVLNITVSDGLGTDWDEIDVKVTDEFPPSLVENFPDVTLEEDTFAYPFNITHYFYDSDNNADYLAVGNKYVEITFMANKSVKLTPAENWFGTEMVILRALDPSGALIEDAFNVIVLPVNDAPEIHELPDQKGHENSAWTLDIAPYLEDVDNLYSELTISTDSPYVTVNGLNLTFRYSGGVKGDIVTIMVSDGDEVVYGQFDVEIGGETKEASSLNSMFLWIIPLIVIIVIIVLTYMLMRRRKFIIEDVFLMHKDGALLAHTTTRIVPDMDTDLFSGMLTAIQNFVKDSFVDEKEYGLKRLEFGDSKIAIELNQAGNLTLALVYKGNGNEEQLSKLSSKALEEIDLEYREELENWNGELDTVRGTKNILTEVFKR